MNADEVSRIFDDYIRTDQMNPTGIGLGMSIAKQLARLHGGEISASSDGPGRGSEITVSLPLASEGAGSGGQE
jgi:signal transduction histidine kinase